jgi:hypothetical protein
MGHTSHVVATIELLFEAVFSVRSAPSIKIYTEDVHNVLICHNVVKHTGTSAALTVAVTSNHIRGKTRCVSLHYDSSKRRVCTLYKFVHFFKVVKLFLKHHILSTAKKTNRAVIRTRSFVNANPHHVKVEYNVTFEWRSESSFARLNKGMVMAPLSWQPQCDLVSGVGIREIL